MSKMLLPSEVKSLIAAMGPNAWRLTPATFAVHHSQGRWKAAKHLRYVAAIIAAEVAKGDARIIVSMPPRHGKSEEISYWTPLWALDKWPHWPIIHASYGADLSEGFTQRVRDQISLFNDDPSSEYRAHLGGTKRTDRFDTEEGGGMIASGVAGPITGRGAMLLLIDDYLKNAKAASSEGIRNDQWEWLISTALTRLEPHGSVIICATRWNRDDIIGRLLDPNRRAEVIANNPGLFAKPWTYIELPALAYADDPLGRKIDEVLWAERYPLARLNELAAEMGGDNSYFWMALFQQRPIPRSAGLLTAEMFQKVSDLPHYSHMRWMRSWDLAASPEKGDYLSGVLIGENRNDHKVYIGDVVRERLGPADIDRLLLTTAEQDGPGTQIWIEQEPGSSGKIAVDHYCRVVLRGYAAHGERSTGDKFIRAQPLFGCIQNRNLYLLKAHWNSQFINEYITFPDGTNDDQVDSGSLGYSKLMGRRFKGVTWASAAQAYQTPPNGLIIDQKSGKLITPQQIIRQRARVIMGPTWRS